MLNPSFHFLMKGFSLIACAVSIAMLVLFPAVTCHRYRTHFRPPEVRRSLERHTCVAPGGHNAEEPAVRPALLPTFFAPDLVAPTATNCDRNVESSHEVPLRHLFNRLKLGPSGSSGQDPLLAA